MTTVWTIAGSDSGAGAGLQADLRAFDAMEVHGCSAVAAVTAQNSVAVTHVEAMPTALLDAQLAALADDMPPVAIKLGLLGSVANVRCVATWIDRLRRRAPLAVVVDPLWRASTGTGLADDELRAAMLDLLLPRADVVTPNRAEAAWLLGRPVADVREAAAALRRLGAGAVVVTGGDEGTALSVDWLDTPHARGGLVLPRIATRHHHGSGCVFAASLAAAMARGFCAADAAVLAKMATAAGLHEAEAVGGAGSGAGAVRPLRGFGLRRALMPRLVDDIAAGTPAFAELRDAHLGLYAIADEAAAIERLLAAGVRTLQLRIKDAGRGDLREQIARSVRAAREAGAQLFVNDLWRLAIDAGAYGVHLGQEDLLTADLGAIARAGLRLGVSSHSPWELARALSIAPSYVACGPVHATTTKAMPWRPQGPGNLAWWCAMSERPVVAIGGMDEARGAEAVRCGARGVAVLRGLAEAVDLDAKVSALQSALNEAAWAPRVAPPYLPSTSLAEWASERGFTKRRIGVYNMSP